MLQSPLTTTWTQAINTREFQTFNVFYKSIFIHQHGRMRSHLMNKQQKNEATAQNNKETEKEKNIFNDEARYKSIITMSRSTEL